MSEEAKAPVRSVLFTCSQNSVRSPMAEGLARRMFGPMAYVDSAGLIKRDRDPFTLAVLNEIGISMENDLPRNIYELSVDSFDLIVTLSNEVHQHVLDMARTSAVEVVHWDIDDPTLVTGTREQRMQAYRTVRDKLKMLIKTTVLPRVRGGVQPA